MRIELECLRSSRSGSRFDTASHKPYVFVRNGKTNIANIVYIINRKYMNVVQTIFTIIGQTGDLGASSTFDPL